MIRSTVIYVFACTFAFACGVNQTLKHPRNSLTEHSEQNPFESSLKVSDIVAATAQPIFSAAPSLEERTRTIGGLPYFEGNEAIALEARLVELLAGKDNPQILRHRLTCEKDQYCSLVIEYMADTAIELPGIDLYSYSRSGFSTSFDADCRFTYEWDILDCWGYESRKSCEADLLRLEEEFVSATGASPIISYCAAIFRNKAPNQRNPHQFVAFAPTIITEKIGYKSSPFIRAHKFQSEFPEQWHQAAIEKFTSSIMAAGGKVFRTFIPTAAEVVRLGSTLFFAPAPIEFSQLRSEYFVSARTESDCQELLTQTRQIWPTLQASQNAPQLIDVLCMLKKDILGDSWNILALLDRGLSLKRFQLTTFTYETLSECNADKDSQLAAMRQRNPSFPHAVAICSKLGMNSYMIEMY